MTTIRHHAIHNGNRYWAETNEGLAALTLDVHHDQTDFTVYDGYGEPVGHVLRPRLDGKDGHNGFWYVYSAAGLVRSNAVGPLTCLRSLAMALGI